MQGLTSTIGEQFIELDTAPSTNKSAAELLRLSKLRHGAVILAHAQTAGSGQRGRSWLSEAGLDLTFSIVLRPTTLRADAQFVLSKLAALAVHDTVKAHVSAEVRVKWPNDVLVDRRKVAGILIQNELQGERVAWSIVGIGLNVNSTRFDEALAATSLALENGGTLDRMLLLVELCNRLGELWEDFEAGRTPWQAAYTERLWSRGRWADMLLDGAPVQLRPMDVDGHGRLLVEHPGGEVVAHGLDRLRFAPR